MLLFEPMPGIYKTQRNKQIYTRWKKGYSTADLARIYELARPTVREILERECERNGEKLVNVKRRDLSTGAPCKTF